MAGASQKGASQKEERRLLDLHQVDLRNSLEGIEASEAFVQVRREDP